MRVLINKILKELHIKSIIKKVLNENYYHKTLNEEPIEEPIEDSNDSENDNEEGEDGVIFPPVDVDGLTPQEAEHNKNKNNPSERKFDYNKLKDRPVTVLSNEITRKRDIENENHGKLPTLSIDYGGNKESKSYKSNLKLLQYILLQPETWDRDRSQKLPIADKENGLREEIKSGEFGEITHEVLKKFQRRARKTFTQQFSDIENHGYGSDAIQSDRCSSIEHSWENEFNGVVDEWTWCKLMQVTNYRELSKLESIIEDRDIPRETIDRITDIAEIKTLDANEDTFDDSKRSMFKSLSLKLFSNLANNKIYSTTNKRTWENIKNDFLKGIQRVEEIEELEKDREEFIQDYPDKGHLLWVKFDKLIKNLINDVEEGKVNKEDINKFWKPYKKRWVEIQRKLGGGNAEAEKELVDLQKEYINYREKKNPSNESIFEDLILALKEGLRDRKLSITDINTILHNASDAIYKVFDKDGQNSTKQNKIRGVIKNILNTIKDEEKVDVFTVVDLLQKINLKKLQYDLYEKSFCECDGDYFEGCGSKKGDKSSLLNKGVEEIKRYLDGDLEDSSISGASKSIYNLIIDSETTKADKYDIVSKNPITLENSDIIKGGKKIEVKKYPVAAGNEYTLSEFIGLYKKTENVEKYRKKNGNHYIKYNKIIEGVVDLLKKDDGGLKDKFIGDDKLFGIFVDDYQFYNYNQIELSWSADSDLKKTHPDEKRITLKFKIKENAKPTRWVEGNCNIDTPIKESKTKSTIKKLLKEEFNDLGWIEKAFNSKLSKNENWILVNDIDRESISEGHEIQKYLFDLGYDWGSGDFQSLKDFCIYTIYHYGNIKDGNQIYYQDGCRSAEVRISDKDIKGGRHMIYYWSDLKPKTIKEENEFDWIRDVEAIKSPKVSENNRYVIWLGELEGYEREQIKDWLFKNLSKCNKQPFTDLNFEDKAVVTFSSIPCGVGGFKDSVYEDAKDAYQTWSKYMIPLDPQKILKGVNINESQDFDWTDEVKPTLNVAFEEGMIKKGDVLTLSGELTDSEGRFPIQVSDFKIKIETLRGPDSAWSDISHSFFIPLQEKYFEHLGYDETESGASIRFANTDGKLEVLDIS